MGAAVPGARPAHAPEVTTALPVADPDSPIGVPALPLPPRREPPASSLRSRIAFSYTFVLVLAAAVLLLFVNAAARLAQLPIEQVVVNTVGGFSYTQPAVDAQKALAHQQTLDQLRFYSILGFAVMVFVGVVVGWVVSGRALRPIGRIAGVAERIGAENLHERIGLQGPDDELKRLADSFDAMVDRLDTELERQRRFVADASHELRTPLTALQLGLDSVRDDPRATADDYRRVAGDAAEATLRMRRLVEDLLALADGSPPAPPVPVSLSALAESVCDEVEPLAAARGVQVGSAVPAGVVGMGDPTALRRALRNLVENGVRYNREEGGHVMIEQAAAPEGHVAVAVRDDGIGIPADRLPLIFDRFYRVDSGRSRAEGGSGLGLSIVAKLIGEAGGRIAVESVVGEGSRFIVTLRSVPPAVTAASTEEG